MNPLQHRLAALRRRLRLVVTFRGVSLVLAVLFLVAAVGGLLDWRIHLPSLVRAVLLTGTLTGAGYLGYRHCLRPLWAKTDDLSLALRIEARYTILNDALASAVQFLEQPADSDRSGSPSLRKEAVQRALGKAQGFDFSTVVDTQGIRAAGLSLAGAGALALALTLLFPHEARTAFLRLTHPFGGYDWPRQTQLEIEAKTRAARGEAFEIRGHLRGVIPERAVVEYRFEGAPALRETYEIARSKDGLSGELMARLEPGRVQQSFRFQLRAHDAVSPWHEVEVLPPPQLAPLDGRRSPQIYLQYPDYTDLPPQQLPDGVTSIEAIAGTHVTLRAALDRPIVRAWLQYPPDLEPTLAVAAGLLPLSLPIDGKRIPAWLSADGRVLVLDFLARVSGTLALSFEDELGLGNTRLVELRTVADPAPVVYLERPSRIQDNLDVLPDAEITLQVQAEDSLFAVRSAYLEYGPKRGEGAAALSEPRRLPLYDHEAVGEAVPQLLSGLAGLPVPMAAPPLRLRTQHLEIGRRWSLGALNLKEGDVLTIQACALDFDDVTTGKKPGRSHEVEIRIVGRTALDISLNQHQAQIQQELIRLHKLQQEALDKVIPAEAHWRNRSQLLPKHVDELIQAEQLQQQIRARVGTRQEGLRAEVARVLQALHDNHLPRSGTQDRMEAVGSELDRLAREELDQIEPRLTEARKESEDGPDKRSPEEKSKGPLPQARKHQEEVKKTLNELLKLLEPWSSTREVKGEARSILQDQRKLAEQTENMAKDIKAGESPGKLDAAQRAELEKAEELQKNLKERTEQLLDKLERLAGDKEKQDPETAAQLRDAARKGRDDKNNAAGKMQEAVTSIRENRLAEAGNQQRAGIKAMEEVVKALEDRREEELDRLIKKMKEAEQKLAELADRQDRLQKKVREANQMADQARREEELKRLAREQERLQQETQEMLRELSRMRVEQASQALSQANGRMQQANRQMDRGDNPEEQQQEALDRLNEAQQELQQAREEAEEELARERLAKVADLIKGLKERQLALASEAARIQRLVLQEKKWTRPLQSSLINLGENQRALGKETEDTAKEKLAEAKVFARLLTKAADAMSQAADRIEARLNGEAQMESEGGLNLQAENAAQQETEQWQLAAVRRIDQLLDALKPEAGLSLRPASQGQGGGGGGQPKQKTAGTGEDIPPIAQLKALRSLQQEINERTQGFHKKHPDVAKLNAKEKEELEAIRTEQREVADLFQEITAPSEPEGEKK